MYRTNNCMGCETCYDCGAKEGYNVYFCDKCHTEDSKLFYAGSQKLCAECFADISNSTADEYFCEVCGDDTRLYYDGKYVCVSCLEEILKEEGLECDEDD